MLDDSLRPVCRPAAVTSPCPPDPPSQHLAKRQVVDPRDRESRYRRGWQQSDCPGLELHRREEEGRDDAGQDDDGAERSETEQADAAGPAPAAVRADGGRVVWLFVIIGILRR